MLSVGQRISIYGFMAVIVCATYFGLFVTFDTSVIDKNNNTLMQEDVYSYFKDMKLFKLSDGDSKYHLEAEEVSHNLTTNVFILTSPNGVITDQKSAQAMYYQAYTGVFNIKESYLSLRGKVVVRDQNIKIESDNMNFSDNSQIVTFRGDVNSMSKNFDSDYEVAIKSDRLKYNLVSEVGSYTGSVVGEVKRIRGYEDSIKFLAQVMHIDKNARMASLDGDVRIKKTQLVASARNGEIYLENYNKKLKYYALYDDVVIEETVSPKGQVPFKRKAFSEKLEGYMAEDKIVLLGYPKVYQREDVLKGNTIVLRRDIEAIEVDDANTNFKIR